MKTRQQAARDYADKACDTTPRKNDGYPLTRTLGELKDDAIQDFLAGCEFEAHNRWIPVNERTPPDYERVLWIDSRDGMINLGFFVWRQTPVDYCTHWMPLPEPPKPQEL